MGRRADLKASGAAAFVLGAVAAVVIVSQGYLGGGSRVALVQRGPGDAWEQGYLWAPPGEDNIDYQNEHYGRLVEASRQDSSKSNQGGRVQLRQVPHLQSLCGFGSGCESDNVFQVREAKDVNKTAVMEGMKNRSVSEEMRSEVKSDVPHPLL